MISVVLVLVCVSSGFLNFLFYTLISYAKLTFGNHQHF